MIPDRARNGGAALIVTAELPVELQVWTERLRRTHYPPERNRAPAHVTLFHSLPPSCEAELRDALAWAAREHAPVPARMEGPMSLGNGTALRINSHAMLTLHSQLAERFVTLLTPADRHEPRLHVTVQNKVSKKQAATLQAELARTLRPREFRFRGLALHRYRDGPWEPVKRWSFRG